MQKSVTLSAKEWESVAKVANDTGGDMSGVIRHWVLWALEEMDRIRAGRLSDESERAVELLSEDHPQIAEKLRGRLAAELKKSRR